MDATSRGHPDTCPLCYANRKMRTQAKGHRYYRAPRIQHVKARDLNVRKPDLANRGVEGAIVCPDGEFASAFPLVCQYLTERRYDDGSEREPSTVTLFFEDQPKLSLADKDLKRSAYVTGDDWWACLVSLENKLLNNTVEWRNWKPQGRKK